MKSTLHEDSAYKHQGRFVTNERERFGRFARSCLASVFLTEKIRPSPISDSVTHARRKTVLTF